MDNKYLDPPWAVKPRRVKCTLLEVKNGVVMGEHEISHRPATVIGRNEDVAHLVQNHASISRQHARLAFDSSDTLWLKDLASTHGVTVNKKRVPSKSIGKVESLSTEPGTRGVVLHDGDIIQLGASTRIFVVEIHQTDVIEDETNDVGALVDGSTHDPWKKEMTGINTAFHSLDKSEEVISDTEDILARLPSDLTLDQIPENLHSDWQKLQALKYKLENVRLESDRIQNKLSSQQQLTSGQERQLERNQERIDQLEQQIQIRENDLLSKLYPEKSHHHPRNKRKFDDDEFVDDDGDGGFFDRTKQPRKQNHSNESDFVESEGTLLSQWNELIEKRKRLSAYLEDAQSQVIECQHAISILQDSEDLFFAQNDLSLASDKLKTLQTDMQQLEQSLKETKRLLQITSPSLILDLETGQVGGAPINQNRKDPTTSQQMATENYGEPQQEKTQLDSARTNLESEIMPSPQPPPVAQMIDDEDEENKLMPPPRVPLPVSNQNSGAESLIMPPPQLPPNIRARSKRIIGPSVPSSLQAKGSYSSNSNSIVGAIQSAFGATSSIETSISQENAQISDIIPNQHNTKQQHGLGLPPAILNDGDIRSSDTHDCWQAPKGQDGSGITKLNAKFLGKY